MRVIITVSGEKKETANSRNRREGYMSRFGEKKDNGDMLESQ